MTDAKQADGHVGDESKLVRVPAPSAAEIKKITDHTDIKYNLAPVEHLSHKVAPGDSKTLGPDSCMIACKRILKGEIIYRGHAMFSYKVNTEDDTTLPLDISLTSMPRKDFVMLYNSMLGLYPTDDRDMAREVGLNYGTGGPVSHDSEIMNPKYHLLMWIKLNQYVDNVHHSKARRYIYRSASKFNHSCVCNCYWDIIDGVLIVKAIKDIEPGQECTMLYDMYWMTRNLERKAQIKDVFGFECNCELCASDATRGPEAHMQICAQFMEIIKRVDCAVCGTLADKMLRCTRCRTVVYCSKACQINDWAFMHKALCGKSMPRDYTSTLTSKQKLELELLHKMLKEKAGHKST